MATRRNREPIELGRAILEAVSLEEANHGDQSFDKVFAFNVAPFWLRPHAAFGAVHRRSGLPLLGRPPCRAGSSPGALGAGGREGSAGRVLGRSGAGPGLQAPRRFGGI